MPWHGPRLDHEDPKGHEVDHVIRPVFAGGSNSCTYDERVAQRQDPSQPSDMMTGVSTKTDMTIKTPWHLWLVGVIAVLFNAIGAFDYVMSMAQGGSYMASAGMTPAQIAHYQEMPIWMIAVWTIGVWGAMLGSVLILLRHKLAVPVFAVSLAAFLVSLIYTYVLTDGGEIMGGQMAIASVVITALLLFFMWYSWLMTKRNVLR